MSDTNAWTVGRLLTWTTDYLKQQGAANPRLDAEVLLAAARNCERIALYTAYDQLADEPTRAVFREYVRRRAAGEPVAYLVGHREFFSLSFQVTPDVLIPRPETEHLVIEVLDLLKTRPADADAARVADVGTGSGAIAVSVARHATRCQLTALDLSVKALDVARRNADRHGVADRIEFVHSDLLAATPVSEPFDLIVSNPPYVSQAEWDRLPPDVRDYEPQSALVGGATGSETIARLIPQAAERLRPAGWLLLEISPMIEAAVHRLLGQDGHFAALATVKDLAGLPRVVKAQRF
ncbi:MAG: peptide chain release factor N(5)-glutamine methyltransferase [Candidatus Anammoximicrobium sp.]|nr:peptide chain release factor N(5)-glutamine methyltransferase [Candidatus Anammoximicrobium sp.]